MHKNSNPNILATPSLVAAVINGKYTNAIPLYRQEQEYARNDVNISRQTMANRVITVVETAKANGLNIYQYFSHILTEIPKHMDDTRMEFLDDLLPWSDNVPDICRKKHKNEQTPRSKICGVNYFNARMAYRLRSFNQKVKFLYSCVNSLARKDGHINPCFFYKLRTDFVNIFFNNS